MTQYPRSIMSTSTIAAAISNSSDADHQLTKRERNIDLIVIQLTFTSLALVFTIIRVYIKVVISRKSSLDDYLMYLAMVS